VKLTINPGDQWSDKELREMHEAFSATSERPRSLCWAEAQLMASVAALLCTEVLRLRAELSKKAAA